MCLYRLTSDMELVPKYWSLEIDFAFANLLLASPEFGIELLFEL